MLTNGTWQMFAQIVRSRPFLLCVILFLLGFLLMQYTTPSGEGRFLNSQFPPINNHWHSNQSAQKSLYIDSIPLRGNSQFVDINAQHSVVKVQESKIPEISGKCSQKKFDVSFLKVHKAGSTTLMNIFLRFAIEHHLNIVLPRKSSGYGFNYLGYGETVSKDKIVPLPANETYNILCNHVVYNRDAFHSILPEDTVYVGIIRDPVSHFKSAASYYGFYKHLRELASGKPQGKVVSEFLKNPSQSKIPTYFVYNRMSFDFGMEKPMFHNVTYVDKYIETLDKDYSLVLILEHFQDSLVLMKRVLCWDTKDILYVPLNERKSKPDFNLDQDDTENLRKWNRADFKLYEHFHKVYSEKVKSLGDDLKEEVKSFVNIQENVRTFCEKTVARSDTTSIYTVPRTKWNEGFTVTRKDCQLMMEPELTVMHRLIENAWARYNGSGTKKS